MMLQQRTVLLTGPPGAGKGTQAELVAQRYDWHVFSVGQLLRDTANPEIKTRMDAGDLLPQEQVIDMVIAEIEQSQSSVMVDGFPRRLDQAEAFDEAVREYGLGEFTVLALMVDKNESWQRIAGRGRDDDQRKAWEHRWEEYHVHTEPAIDYYRSSSKLYEVDGSGGVEEVATRVANVLGI